jgi:hypothetical protein
MPLLFATLPGAAEAAGDAVRDRERGEREEGELVHRHHSCKKILLSVRSQPESQLYATHARQLSTRTESQEFLEHKL